MLGGHIDLGLNSDYVAVIGYLSYLVHNGQFTEKGRYFIIARLCLGCQNNAAVPKAASPHMCSSDLPWYCMMEPANLSQKLLHLGQSYLVLVQ